MSNAHYRNVAEPDSLPQTSQPSREAFIEQLEAGARRRKMIDDAIYKLYLKRDGDRIELQLEIFDVALAMSLICRKDELKRAQERGITLREKGERPVCSFSETRLYAARQQQLLALRSEIMASCRAEVMDWLGQWEPDDDAALRVALDSCLGEFSEVTRKAAESTRDRLGPKPPEVSEETRQRMARENQVLADAAAVMDALSPEDRRAMKEAEARFDPQAMREIIKRQPEAWQHEFKETSQAVLKLREARIKRTQ